MAKFKKNVTHIWQNQYYALLNGRDHWLTLKCIFLLSRNKLDSTSQSSLQLGVTMT